MKSQIKLAKTKQGTCVGIGFLRHLIRVCPAQNLSSCFDAVLSTTELAAYFGSY